MIHTGRHFLQIPGPTNIPDRDLRAIGQPIIDHRGAEFAKLAMEVLEGLGPIFQTNSFVAKYPSSGNGNGEEAVVNRICQGRRVGIINTDNFSKVRWQSA